MSPPKPTAESPSSGKRLLTWWEGWPRIVVLAIAGLVSLAVLAGALQGIRLLETVKPPVDPEVAQALARPETDWGEHPRNVLVLGNDSREGLSQEEEEHFGSTEIVEGERSDTIILMHIDPRREEAVVIHFPRDLRVNIPGHGYDRINAAFEIGGSELAVRTIRAFTGLQIHNYVEVGLQGFQGLVDSLGGVRICVDRPLIDEVAGLFISSAGCHTLNGEEALAFARARHVEGDTIPDFSRIGRQQQLMRAIMNRLLSAPSLLNRDLISEAASNITTDETISLADFVYLGSKIKELAQEDPSGSSTLDFRVVPATPQTIDGVSYVVPQQPQTDQLFQRLRERKPLGDIGKVLAQTALSPAQVVVQARDAGDAEEATRTTAFLRRAGFQVPDPAPAPSGYEESVILFRPGSEENAEVVQGYFGGLQMQPAPAELFDDTTQVMVIVGPDFTGLTST